MTFEEVDNALEELETRLERLRALYEQYFLGFEKIEPTVPRKDVDRRIYVLRREKIRNTGKRFKLQTLISRYNTFQQYWQRVCREIENGTYRRHVLRAERMMNPDKQLTIATKRRFGRAMALEQQAAAAANGTTAQASVPPPAELDPPAPITERMSPLPPSAPSRPRAAPAARPATLVTPEERSFESLELDMGFLDSWIPGVPDAPAPPARTQATPPAQPIGAVSAPAARKPVSSPRAAPPPKPGAPGRAVPPPKPQQVAKATPEAKSSPKAAPPPEAKSSPKAAPSPGPKSSPRGAAAAKPRSSPRAAPPPKPSAAKPPPKPTATESAIADERVRELHRKLMEMKRQNKEAGQVSLEGLAKTLRDTENKLRTQHKNRKIDFDVVIRDGKAIVKPTVR